MVVLFWFLHADNSRLSGARIWDQSPTPRRISVAAPRRAQHNEFPRRLKVEPQTRANQLLPEIATLIGFDLGARIIEVVVFDEGAELRIPIVICACEHLPREVRVIVPSATVKGAAGSGDDEHVARAAEQYYLTCISLANELHKNLVVERFCEKGECSPIECALADRQIVSSANKDYPCLGRILTEASLHFQTVHLRHPYVENRHATFPLFEVRKKVGRVAKFLHGKTGRRQQPAKRLQHGNVIVEQPDTIAAESAQR